MAAPTKTRGSSIEPGVFYPALTSRSMPSRDLQAEPAPDPIQKVRRQKELNADSVERYPVSEVLARSPVDDILSEPVPSIAEQPVNLKRIARPQTQYYPEPQWSSPEILPLEVQG